MRPTGYQAVVIGRRRRFHLRRPRSAALPERVRDHLDTHHGWWTSTALAEALGAPRGDIAAAANALVDLGWADTWATARSGRAWTTTRYGIR